MGEAIEQHADAGAVLLVYEPSSIKEKNEDAQVAITASHNEDIDTVLIAVLLTLGYEVKRKETH